MTCTDIGILNNHVLHFEIQLKRAAKGLGTDERMVVSVLCSRTKAQIDRIDNIFRQRYKRTLKEYIEREMGGNLKTFLSYTQMAEVKQCLVNLWVYVAGS